MEPGGATIHWQELLWVRACLSPEITIYDPLNSISVTLKWVYRWDSCQSGPILFSYLFFDIDHFWQWVCQLTLWVLSDLSLFLQLLFAKLVAILLICQLCFLLKSQVSIGLSLQFVQAWETLSRHAVSLHTLHAFSLYTRCCWGQSAMEIVATLNCSLGTLVLHCIFILGELCLTIVVGVFDNRRSFWWTGEMSEVLVRGAEEVWLWLCKWYPIFSSSLLIVLWLDLVSELTSIVTTVLWNLSMVRLVSAVILLDVLDRSYSVLGNSLRIE